MRNQLVIAAALAATLATFAAGAPPPAGNVSISGAWALYPLAVRWTEEFGKLNPKVHFDVSAGGAGKGMTDALAGAADIGMVSREVSPAEVAQGAVAIAVAKDGVVPVISARNPVLVTLQRQGVTREAFVRLWIAGEAATWGGLAGSGPPAPVRVYTRSDACGAAETWARFLGGRQEDLKGIGVYGDPGIAEAVRRDPLGIGFNNVNFAFDAGTGRPVAGLAVLPLDLDGDGRVGPGEEFYGAREALLAAIADGRYPSPPARDLYFVVKGRPANPAAAAFLRWVLGDGQHFVAETGYIAVAASRLASQLARPELLE